MKPILASLLLAAVAAAALPAVSFGEPTPAPSASPAPGGKYVCPMHPEVVTDKPADCPKCGMHLVPKKDGDKKKS